MANNVDPDQTAPIGAVCSGSTLFASILNSSVLLYNYLEQTTSADNIFRCIFFLGALRVNQECQTDWIQIRPDIFRGLIWFQTVAKLGNISVGDTSKELIYISPVCKMRHWALVPSPYGLSCWWDLYHNHTHQRTSFISIILKTSSGALSL